LSRIKYAMDAITSFSYKPLRMSFVLASLMIFSALVSGLVALLSSNSLGYGIATAIFLTGGLLLFCLGLLGEYVGRIYDEVRARPLSLINTVYEPGEIGLRQLAGHQSHTAMERIFPAA